MNKIEWGVDWSQSSTLRGIIRIVGFGVALYLVTTGNNDGALTAISITGIITGSVGVSTKN